ncbi:unnamed protein product [Trichobilharzia szidati]|nr:unnamed protein product [Trichobilharzia szidati]
MYHDLAAYINSVVVASTKQSSSLSSNHMDSQSKLYPNASDTNELQSYPEIVSDTPANMDTTDATNVTQISQNDTDLSSSSCPTQQIDVVQNSVEQAGGDMFTEFCEDDFADFVSNGPADENWATFTDETVDNIDSKVNNAPDVINSENFTEEDNDSEDFGEFTQFTPSVVAVPPTTVEIPSDCRLTNERQTSTPGILERLLLKLEPSLDKAFGQHFINPHVSENLKSSHGSIEIGLQACSGEQPSSKEVLSSSTMLNHRIWNRLCSPDRLPEVHQQWWKSPIFMTYLNAIDVNAQNAIPAFASQLRLLEPVRLTSQNYLSKNTLTNGGCHTQGNNEQHSVLSANNNNTAKSLNFKADNDQVYKNNNDNSNGKITEYLDLDFFETRESQQNSRSPSNGGERGSDDNKHLKLSDLEAELSAYTIPPPTNCQPPPPPLVADLKLLEMGNKRSKLSDTVRSTLKRLPIINYMRSKRLMFPVQQQQQQPQNSPQ